MIGSTAGLQIWIATAPVDMRQGFDRLAARVREHLGHDPLAGHLFVFRNKSSERVKVLYWDGTGLVLYYKRTGGNMGVRSCPTVGTTVRSSRRRRRCDGRRIARVSLPGRSVSF